MDKFTVVLDIKTYVESLIRDGSTPFKAVKVGFIIVDEAKPGTELKTYVDGLIETVSISKEGQVIATKADDNGVPIRYENGNINQWLMPRATLDAKYVNVRDNLYVPRRIEQTFLKIKEPICFTAPWGSEEKLLRNGYLNITDLNSVYGIQEQDFLDTYQVI